MPVSVSSGDGQALATELVAATNDCVEWVQEMQAEAISRCRDRLKWEMKRDASTAAVLHDLVQVMPLLTHAIDDVCRDQAEAIRRLKHEAESANRDVQRLSAEVLTVEELAESLIAAVSPMSVTLALDIDPSTIENWATFDKALTAELTAAAASSVGRRGAEMQCTLRIHRASDVLSTKDMSNVLVDLELFAAGTNGGAAAGAGVGAGDDPLSIAADLLQQAHDKTSPLLASSICSKVTRVSVWSKQILLDKLSVAHAQLAETREELVRVREDEEVKKAQLHHDLWQQLSAEIEKRMLAEASAQEKEEEEHQLREELERMGEEKLEHVSALLDKNAEDARRMASLQEEIATLNEELVRCAHAAEEARTAREQLSANATEAQTLTTQAQDKLRLAETNARQSAQDGAAAQEQLRADCVEQLSVAHAQLAETREELVRVREDEEVKKAQLHHDLWQQLSAEIEKRVLAEASAQEKEEEEHQLREELERMGEEKLEHVSALLDKNAEDARRMASLQEEIATLNEELTVVQDALAKGKERQCDTCRVLKDSQSVLHKILQHMCAELTQAQELLAATQTAMQVPLCSAEVTCGQEGSLTTVHAHVQSSVGSPKREIEAKASGVQRETRQSTTSERELAVVQREIDNLLSADPAPSSKRQIEAVLTNASRTTQIGSVVRQTQFASEMHAPSVESNARENAARARAMVLLEAGVQLSSRLLGMCGELHEVLESIEEETLDAQDDLDLVSQEMDRLVQENETLQRQNEKRHIGNQAEAPAPDILASPALPSWTCATFTMGEASDGKEVDSADGGAHLLNLWAKRLNPSQIEVKERRGGVDTETGDSRDLRTKTRMTVDAHEGGEEECLEDQEEEEDEGKEWAEEEEEEEEEEEGLFKADAVNEEEEEEEEGSSAHTGHTLYEGVAGMLWGAPMRAGTSRTDENNPSGLMHLFHPHALLRCAETRSRVSSAPDPTRGAVLGKESEGRVAAAGELEGKEGL